MSEDTTAAASDESGDGFVAAATDGGYTLIVADFADTATAWNAYEAL